MPCDGHGSRFRRVAELAMAAFGAIQTPAVLLKPLDNISDLQWLSVLSAGIVARNIHYQRFTQLYRLCLMFSVLQHFLIARF
jgi:hypothetical protein